jgi:hypothetical protein
MKTQSKELEKGAEYRQMLVQVRRARGPPRPPHGRPAAALGRRRHCKRLMAVPAGRALPARVAGWPPRAAAPRAAALGGALEARQAGPWLPGRAAARETQEDQARYPDPARLVHTRPRAPRARPGHARRCLAAPSPRAPLHGRAARSARGGPAALERRARDVSKSFRVQLMGSSWERAPGPHLGGLQRAAHWA